MYRIHPAVTLTWRDDSTASFGISEPLVLEGLTPGSAEFLLRLRAGIVDGRLESAVSACGLSRQEAEELLTILRQAGLLAPRPAGGSAPWHPNTALMQAWALCTGQEPESSARLASDLPLQVCGVLGRELCAALRAAGFDPTELGDLGSGSFGPDTVTIVSAECAADVAEIDTLVAREQAHLPIVFTDAGAEVGPVIRPGLDPCATCRMHQRLDADPGLLPSYRQLLDARLDCVDAIVFHSVTATVVRLLREHCAAPDDPAVRRSRLLRLPDCLPEELSGDFHPRCDCLRPAPLGSG